MSESENPTRNFSRRTEAQLLEELENLQRRIEELKLLEAQRNHAEGALRELESLLANAERMAHVGRWEMDISSSAVRWSDEMYRIFGLAREEFEGTKDAFLAKLHPDDAEEAEKKFCAAISPLKAACC